MKSKPTFIVDDDKYNLFVNGIITIMTVGGFCVLGIYSLFDLTQKPAFIRKYKVNPHTNEPPDYKKFLKVFN